jgi:hypothetical protein
MHSGHLEPKHHACQDSSADVSNVLTSLATQLHGVCLLLLLLLLAAAKATMPAVIFTMVQCAYHG